MKSTDHDTQPVTREQDKVRVEFDLSGDSAEMFGDALRALNAGLSPADPNWWTPSQLAAALVTDRLVESLNAEGREATKH